MSYEMGSRYATLKRAVDLLGGGLLLVVAAPVLAAVALAIRVVDGKPVVFPQARPGRHEVPFTLYKFRTMVPDAPGLSEADRLTRLGPFLRRLSLDELPQLWNVVRGDMSLVGPRPLLIRYLPYFSDRERHRFSVRPGLTGLAQTAGRNQLGWDDRLALDVWYVEHESPWLDVKIVLRTIALLLRARGVVVAPSAAMLDFDTERESRGALSHQHPIS